MKVGDTADGQESFKLSNNYSCTMPHVITMEGAADDANDVIANSMTTRRHSSNSLNCDYMAVDVMGKGTLYVVGRAYKSSTTGELRIGFQKDDNSYSVVSKEATTTNLIEVKADVEEAGTFFIYGTNAVSIQAIVWESDYGTTDGTTGIDSIENGESRINDVDLIYNLNGMCVGKDYKGIIVVRGKKYLVK